MSITGHHTRCILSAMLKHRQGIINVLVNGTTAYNADDSTHERSPNA
jgi:hypothetical protein